MILLIEDDVLLAQSIKELLQVNGYEVYVCNSASAAIKFIKIKYPAVIICDIVLPDRDGFFILNFLRAHFHHDAIGFIFISAVIDSSFVIKGLQLGADDYLRKPFLMQELKLRIDNLINKNNIYLRNNSEVVKTQQLSGNIFEKVNRNNFEFLIRNLIIGNLKNPELNAKFLADHFNLTKFNFATILKIKTGYTSSELIKSIRWSKAKEILFINKGDIYKTTRALGFSNYNYFITKFKTINGESPKQYYLRIINLRT